MRSYIIALNEEHSMTVRNLDKTIGVGKSRFSITTNVVTIPYYYFKREKENVPLKKKFFEGGIKFK